MSVSTLQHCNTALEIEFSNHREYSNSQQQVSNWWREVALNNYVTTITFYITIHYSTAVDSYDYCKQSMFLWSSRAPVVEVQSVTVEDDNCSCVPITVILSDVCLVIYHHVLCAVVPDSLKTLTILPRRGQDTPPSSCQRNTHVGWKYCQFFLKKMYPPRIQRNTAAMTLTWHDWQFYFLCFETNNFLNIWLSQLFGAVCGFFKIFLQSETETDLSSRNIINPPAEAWIVHLICRPQPVSAVLCSVMRYIASLKLRGKRGIIH